jgi:transposase
MRSYSEDIRVRVINAYQNKEGSQRQIAERFNVSLGFVRKLLKQYRTTGSLAPKRAARTRPSKIDQKSLQFILALVDNDSTLTLSALCERLTQERHLLLSRSTMWRVIQKYRPSQSKRPAISQNLGLSTQRLRSKLNAIDKPDLRVGLNRSTSYS